MKTATTEIIVTATTEITTRTVNSLPSLPSFAGKSHIGIFPFRTPIHSVVGAPILIDRKYTEEEICADDFALLNKYHHLYIEGLKRIYAEWNPKCLAQRDARIKELESDPDRKQILENFEDVKKLARAELNIAQ